MSARPQHAPRAVAAADDLASMHDIAVTVTVEIGQAKLTIDDLLALKPGAVFQLDRCAGAAGDIRINGRYVARGEVMNLGDKSGVRITDILKLPAERGVSS